ncbi:Thioredoxin domain-containing protein 9 [Sesamum angolense]|uniref:Thioredoxin domain-containing protein 9 n=1 Tax=Sesamum angolense TaxID=2727404 RepID=A0AAE2C141_9LAMI|nr:Thioredoxin domain-containing protein 9 [Sesamum angolense]
MKKMAEKRSRWIALGHAEYLEIPYEKEFFSVVKASERVVCHFYRENWPCKLLLFPLEIWNNLLLMLYVKHRQKLVMDKHLSILAKQHIETRFVKINAEKSLYLSEKLRIVVLPTLALVKNAIVED